MTFFQTYLPFLFHSYPALKDTFAKRGIKFGMAGEYLSFDSTVQYPLISKHAASFTSEVSMKMENTQPTQGVYTFMYADNLVDKCIANGIKLHGHCGMWHLQNPPWLWETLANGTKADGYEILYHHIRNLVAHYRGTAESMDVVNEYGALFEAWGWGQYLGRECVKFAFDTARQFSGNMKLYYNSFFPNDDDANLAIELLPVVDGIGIQLHLSYSQNIPLIFDRVRRIMKACETDGKLVRFSEISVRGKDDADMDFVAETYGKIVRLALEYEGVVNNFTTWGVKGQAWNGGWMLFDRAGKPLKAFRTVLEELNR